MQMLIAWVETQNLHWTVIVNEWQFAVTPSQRELKFFATNNLRTQEYYRESGLLRIVPDNPTPAMLKTHTSAAPAACQQSHRILSCRTPESFQQDHVWAAIQIKICYCFQPTKLARGSKEPRRSRNLPKTFENLSQIITKQNFYDEHGNCLNVNHFCISRTNLGCTDPSWKKPRIILTFVETGTNASKTMTVQSFGRFSHLITQFLLLIIF